jgi:pyruvate formate lyase activating enzyme
LKQICSICPHHCALEIGQTGLCRARKNVNGKIISINYGRLTALALDPIEKKPLARFHPGSFILSAGSFGCNLRCPFCQNSDISMADTTVPATEVSPEALVEKALALRDRGNIGIAHTYNEPLVGYEYVLDCAKLTRKAGMITVLVTNGTICKEPLVELLPWVDAMNIDLKGFTQAFYDLVGGDLETVKQSIRLSAQRCHVEVTTLIVPGLNDSEAEMDAEAAWLAGISPELPLHISRFFPRFRMEDKNPTPVGTVYALRDVAKKHLKYVYTGNC